MRIRPLGAFVCLFFLFLVIQVDTFAQPGNDNFINATDINSLINTCSANAAYTTVAATADQSPGTCWSNGPNYNVWFKFTATATQYIKVQVKVGGALGSMQNPFVALWDASLVQLNCQNYQGASVSIETDYYGLTPGQTYYISVDNFVGPGYRGTFTLCLSDVVDYNFYEGAADVTSLINGCSANAAYTTLNATADRSAASCWSNGPNYNRWFKFTATATQYIKVQVKVGGALGSMQNPFVALWDASLVQLNCQNYQGASVSIETDYYGLTPGQTYYISVDNFVGPGYRGTFTLCLSDAVDYNFYEGAADVTSLINGCSANAAYTTLNATADRSAASCWSNGPNYNRWFKFTATATQYIKVQVKVGGALGSMQNPFVALWDASLVQLNCQNYQGASVSIETDYYGLTPGQTYYISVDNFVGPGYRGTFTLCLSDAVDYNFYEGAADVTSLINGCSANAAYTTLNATADRSAASCWSNGPNYNRWFKFTATATQYIKVQVKVGGALGSMQNPFVALWDASLVQLNCQNYQGASVSIETDYYGLTPGQTYYISVDNFVGPGYRGTFTLCLSDAVDYNFYEGAADVTSLINGCSANAAYTTLNATADRSAASCWSNGPNYNRWFKFTATATQYIKVQVKVGGALGSIQNPFVALWDASLVQLNCQNYQGASVSIETDYYGLTPGQTYYISVDNFVGPGYRGTFTLCLSDAVDYNFYEGAIAITDLNNWCSANAAYTTSNATADKNKGSCWSNGPNYNRWFKFTAINTSATVQVKVGGAEGTLQNPFVALWASNGTTPLACTNYAGASVDISLTYNSLTIGSTYYISVDNFVGTGYRGTFTLCVTNVSTTTFYSRADGDWNTPATWSNVTYGGAPAVTTPGVGDVVNIRDNSVIVTSAATGAQLNISTSITNASLIVDNAILTINGKIVHSNVTDNSNIITIQNNGTLAVANDYSVTRGGGNSATQFNITSGSANIGQDMNWTSTSGTVSSNSMTLSNSTSLSVGRDVNINYSGGMKISLNFNNSSGLSVGRDFSFTSNSAGQTEAIFNNTATMSIKRNIVRGATPYGMLTFNNSSTLILNGTANQQTIAASAGAGGDVITYNNVIINNTSGFAIDGNLNGVAIINGSLTMTQGIIQTTASNYISLLNGAATTIGNTNSYIDGPMAYEVATNTVNTVRNFPIGNNGSYRPLVLTVTHTSANPVTYTVQHFSSSAAALGYTLAPSTDKVSGLRYWQVSSSDQSNLSSANVRLYYGYVTTDGVTDLSNLTVVKTIGAGTSWTDIGRASATVEPGYIESGAFGSFCTFTLANLTGGGNPLPIVLKSFEGKNISNTVELTWVTASELNSDYFTVEKSLNGLEFFDLLKVDGAGTKDTETFYSAIDHYPSQGKNYYRLRQTDFDGKSNLYPVIVVNSATSLVEVFPNPSRGEKLKIYIPSLIESELGIEVLNSVGTSVYSGRFKNNLNQNKVTTLDDLPPLPAGLYLITIIGRTKSYVAKVIISN